MLTAVTSGPTGTALRGTKPAARADAAAPTGATGPSTTTPLSFVRPYNGNDDSPSSTKATRAPGTTGGSGPSATFSPSVTVTATLRPCSRRSVTAFTSPRFS